MTSTCPRCARPSADGLLCAACSTRLVDDLHSLDGWLDELDVTMSRQTAVQHGTVGRSSGSPAPADLDALSVYSYVRNQLQTWVRELDMGDTGSLADNPRAWARWLADRMQRIRGHEAVDELAGEIDYCRKLIKRVIDRPERVYIGQCETCGASLHAPADAVVAVCRKCQAAGIEPVPEISVIPRRAELLRQAENRELTGPAVMHLVALFWRLTIPRRTFRSWVERGELIRTNPAEGEATYRVGDVLALAQRLDTRVGA